MNWCSLPNAYDFFEMQNFFSLQNMQSNQFSCTFTVCTVYHPLSIRYTIICWCALLNFNMKTKKNRKRNGNLLNKMGAMLTAHTECLFMNSLFFWKFFCCFFHAMIETESSIFISISFVFTFILFFKCYYSC